MLSTPKFRIVYLDDRGTEVEVAEVQAVQADVVRYDMMRHRYRWPAISDAPMLWTSVVGWSALLRTDAQIPSEWDAALPRLLEVTTLDRTGQPVTPDTDDSELGTPPTLGQA